MGNFCSILKVDNSLKVFLREKVALYTFNHSFLFHVLRYKAKTVIIVTSTLVIKLYISIIGDSIIGR